MLSEADLVDQFLTNYSSFSSYFCKEVNWYQKRIDLVQIPVIPTLPNEIYGIEFKLRNWQCCVTQAKRNRGLLPYNYVAFPETIQHRLKLNEIAFYGIGVIIVHETWNEYILTSKYCDDFDRHIYTKLKTQTLQQGFIK
jgi:hypothetical protein